MSFRDIGFILKKEGLSHGIAMIDDDNKTKRLNETSSYVVDSISYSMKTKHLLVAAFSMGFIVIILISNTGLAFNRSCFICWNSDSDITPCSLSLASFVNSSAIDMVVV